MKKLFFAVIAAAFVFVSANNVFASNKMISTSAYEPTDTVAPAETPAAREAATEEPAAEETTAEEPAADVSARERLSSLLIFAGGDKEAEMEIVKTVTAEIETYQESLNKYLPAAEKEEEKQEDNTQAVQVELSQEDKQNVARIAHKLQPIAQMMQAACQEQLSALSPEHIGEQEDKKIRAYILDIYNDLGNMLGELRNASDK